MSRLLAWLVPTTRGGCLLVLFVSGIAQLAIWSALPGSPA